MEKLETFFIRTVAEARKQEQPTSGAISTTEIGDFLTAKSQREENILDNLVTAPLSPTTEDTSVETDKAADVAPVRTDVVPDEDFLAKLTQQTETVETAPVTAQQVKQAEPGAVNTPQQIRKDILDELTGRSQPPENRGEAGDA
jgi:hypothetical protein